MTGPRAQLPAPPAEHPLRAALARGDRLFARSVPALQHMLAAGDHALVGEAVIAQVAGMLADLARQLCEAVSTRVAGEGAEAATFAALLENDLLRLHCHALALEWRLALRLQDELALDPVLSPLIQSTVAGGEASEGALAMATLAAQARFAQAQRRMHLPLAELPAELFHGTLLAARDTLSDFAEAEGRLRAEYDEGAGRLALLGRLVGQAAQSAPRALAIEDAGVALWLSALSARAGDSRDRTAAAAADPELGRLLLTLRAAGVAPTEAERQALRVHPDALLPRGLQDVGTREAAQWLAETPA